MHEDVCNALAHNYRRFLDGLPKDWERKEIGHLGKVVGGGTPSRDVATYWRGAIPWVTPGEISGKAVRTLDETREHISAAALSGSGANVLPAGSLMVTTRATLGSRAINAVPMATNQGFKSVTFKQAADASFYFHFFEKVIPELVRRASGTTFLEISSTEFARIEVPSPSQDEKRVITEILDTCDAAIQKTEALIDNLKAIKQGLLHDLLTRGIDANGRLRPPRAEAPHRYKESTVGWIPKEWACIAFGDVCESSAFGPRFPSDAYDANGPLATLRTTDMDDEGNISLTTMPRAAITPSAFADHLLRAGDMVISRSGTCGVTGVFAGNDIPVVPGAFLIRFRLLDSRLNRFYRRYFNSPLGRPSLERLAVGGVQKNIKGSDVLRLRVPAPPPNEAVDIADRVELAERDVEYNSQLLVKLRLQKSALMNDLLSGRVRVTPLLKSASA
jgi:type I restriction enzyme S subunit